MHNISKNHLQELASEIIVLCNKQSTEHILLKSRELYEMSVLLHHSSIDEKMKLVSKEIENTIVASTNDETKIIHDEIKVEDAPLTVEERIKHIMDNAPKFTPKQTVFSIENIVDDILKSPDPIKETSKVIPKISLEEELKVGITGTIAAELFEKKKENIEFAESVSKPEIPKKSLNDILSNNQIQIGLNDRIAFVKHLFNDNIADYNRVISQLNTFATEQEAKEFIENKVKPDYNWSNKEAFEMRLIQLIERRFL